MIDFFKALVYNPNYPLIFHSVFFILLFTVFYGIYLLVSGNIKAKNILLLLFSLFFYYKISGLYVVLLVGVASSDFLIGRAIGTAKTKGSKKTLMLLSVIIDLGILIFFKYINFFLNSIFGIFSEPAPWLIDLVMPVGISYFIFKTLTYTLDIYREDIDKPEKSFWNYLLYVSFFPNILMGPISRAKDLLPQFAAAININREMIGRGLFLIATGAFKKIFIADIIKTNLVDRVFDSPEYFNGFEALMASYGYMIQLYFDFSGYTDMVIGIAMLLGIVVLPNFNKPFLAQNITDFWRRWHITLSSWLRDYLFTPLSLTMRNAGTIGLMFAVFITFVLCGFWHDAKMTFIVWGSLHAIALVWDIATQKDRNKFKKKINKTVYKVISIFLTLHFLMLTFIFFKARDMETAWYIIKKIFTTTDFGLAAQWVEIYLYPFIIMLVGLILHYTPMSWNNKLQNVYIKSHWILKVLFLIIAIIVIYQSFSTESQPFEYLEF